jgi:hypothetical protein
MSKRTEYKTQLLPLMISEENYAELQAFLINNSGLPGPRSNLELSVAFCDCLENAQLAHELWDLLLAWCSQTPEKSPTNSPLEFLTFCAVQAMGTIYCTSNDKKTKALDIIKNASRDVRWRTREASAMAFQRIEEKNFQLIKDIFELWLPKTDFMEKRAIIATLAHPPILTNKLNTSFCLDICNSFLKDISTSDALEQKTESFKVLVKGMEYAPSVFIAHLPKEGFDLLRSWTTTNNPVIKKIIKSNLGKSRLTKKYVDEVAEILNLINI